MWNVKQGILDFILGIFDLQPSLWIRPCVIAIMLSINSFHERLDEKKKNLDSIIVIQSNLFSETDKAMLDKKAKIVPRKTEGGFNEIQSCFWLTEWTFMVYKTFRKKTNKTET